MLLHGLCNVCGITSYFRGQSQIPLRESLICSNCRTTSRYRSLARGLLKAIHDLTGVKSASLADLQGPPLSIYDVQQVFYDPYVCYPHSDLLANAGHRVYTSIYKPGRELGHELGGNLSNQNLESLTFKDSSFDIVITSDVMEHVRLNHLAHREIRRVLRNGGIYLFTVPHGRQPETLHKVVIHDPRDPTKDEFLGEPEYHRDVNSEDNRALLYRIYGTDIDDELADLGFNVEYCRDDFPQTGIMETELFYCTNLRPASASG